MYSTPQGSIFPSICYTQGFLEVDSLEVDSLEVDLPKTRRKPTEFNRIPQET